jgi:hypothetical protein
LAALLKAIFTGKTGKEIDPEIVGMGLMVVAKKVPSH